MGWIFLLTLLAIAWQVWDKQQKAKALALLAVRQRCQQEGVQLLDDTLVMQRTWPEKRLGRWQLRRDYDFEFSSTGEMRYHGHLVSWGSKVTLLDLQPHRPSAEVISLASRRRAGE
jgi:hypothetical protein